MKETLINAGFRLITFDNRDMGNTKRFEEFEPTP